MFDTVLSSCLGKNILTLPAAAVLTINTLRLTCRKMDVVHIQSSCASFYLAHLSGVVNSFWLCVSLQLQIVLNGKSWQIENRLNSKLQSSSQDWNWSFQGQSKDSFCFVLFFFWRIPEKYAPAELRKQMKLSDLRMMRRKPGICELDHG